MSETAAKAGRPKSLRAVAEIDLQIAALEDRKKQVLLKETERMCRAIGKSGLFDLELSDEELTKALTEVVGRFQKAAAGSAGGAGDAARKTEKKASAHG